jgi:hypothetical protein
MASKGWGGSLALEPRTSSEKGGNQGRQIFGSKDLRPTPVGVRFHQSPKFNRIRMRTAGPPPNRHPYPAVRLENGDGQT